MATFECLGGGMHNMSVEKTDEGLVVTLDGCRKTIGKQFTPSVELLGNQMFFASHEHCIRNERETVTELLEDVMH